jgi:hypothetical protein
MPTQCIDLPPRLAFGPTYRSSPRPPVAQLLHETAYYVPDLVCLLLDQEGRPHPNRVTIDRTVTSLTSWREAGMRRSGVPQLLIRQCR